MIFTAEKIDKMRKKFLNPCGSSNDTANMQISFLKESEIFLTDST